MTARSQLPGVRWFRWPGNVSLRLGALTGIYLSCIFVAWLVVANRLPELEPFAEARNLIAGVTLVLVLAIPVLRFRYQPSRLLVAGLTAWTVLTLTYFGAEFYFSLLQRRMGALHVFMLGAVSYGIVAGFQWVYLMCAETHQRHVAQSGQSALSAGRHRTH